MQVFGYLRQIFTFAWQQLGEAPSQKAHPWRTAVVANMVGQRVLQRTVVLRKASFNSRILSFYTDIRSTKIQPLNENDSFSWLFYDANQQIQLRVQSNAHLLPPAAVAEVWRKIPDYQAKAYATLNAPGTIILDEEQSLFATDEEDVLEQARQNFAIIACTVTEMELLKLDRAGHRRTRFTWDAAAEEWRGTYLVP